MEKQDHAQLVDEIRQLRNQYVAEVPSGRRAWPKSIKERVLQLRQLEFTCDEIGALTGIPVQTIYTWRVRPKPEPRFLPVQVVDQKTVAVPPKPQTPRRQRRTQTTPTVIVIAPNGTRFEGLDVKSALAIARAMGSWS